LLRDELQTLDGPASYQLQRVTVSDEPQPLLIPDLLAVERALEQAGLLRRAS